MLKREIINKLFDDIVSKRLKKEFNIVFYYCNDCNTYSFEVTDKLNYEDIVYLSLSLENKNISLTIGQVNQYDIPLSNEEFNEWESLLTDEYNNYKMESEDNALIKLGYINKAF